MPVNDKSTMEKSVRLFHTFQVGGECATSTSISVGRKNTSEVEKAVSMMKSGTASGKDATNVSSI